MAANNRQLRNTTAAAASVGLVVVAAGVAVLPWGVVVGSVVPRGTLGSAGVPLRSLVSTGVYSVLIGVLATVLGLPAAWRLARSGDVPRGTFWVGLVGGVLLLPSYLPYAGWGILRGANTYLGDILARMDPAISMRVGRGVAVMGMVLWCWPLAAFVMSGFVRSVNAGVLEGLRLESPSRARRWWEVARVLKGGLASSVGCVALVVAGSAIPLHVAQVPTYAIELWKVMQLGHDAGAIWIAAAPLLVIAGVGAWVIARRVTRPAEDLGLPDSRTGAGGAGSWVTAATIAAWAVSVAVPLGLFAWGLQSWVSVPRFWKLSGAAVVQSAEVGAWVGAIGAAITLAVWASVSDGRWWMRRAGVLALGAFLFCGLAPGVLVGSACARAWGEVSWVRDTFAIVVLTHTARFGFVGVLAGWWLARQEGREERWMRELDSGRAARGWWLARARPNLTVVLGVALCMAALSFHEIESTVMVAPPGRQNLAQQVLDYLHYARDEQLSAAAVNLLGIGVLVAGVGAGMAGRSLGRGGSPKNRGRPL